MPRNLELKARVGALAPIRARLAELGASEPLSLAQDDTFFACPSGRLKLRVLQDGSALLIHYQRPDLDGPKESHFHTSAVAAPDSLRALLAQANGLVGRVRKQRQQYRLGPTRIHLDEVEGLGPFVELERELASDEAPEAATAELETLLQRLGIRPEQGIAGAYLDLLNAN